MATKAAIEWTDMSWNPTTGCTKVSPGCKHCYAKTMAKRLKAMGMPGYESDFALTLMPDRLGQPLARKKRTLYFLDRMSDLFHEGVSFEYIDRVFDVIRQTPRHTYQVLTKRAERMVECFSESREVPANAWIGVTVEDREYGVPRIAELKKIEACVRFLSVEPLLEDLGELDLEGVRWVIVGGESGKGARPMREAWVERIFRARKRGNVPFHFKQWGVWAADSMKRSKKTSGRIFLARTWDEMPAATAKNEGGE